MEDILNAVSRVETSLILVENLIQNIFIYELPDGDLAMNLRFPQSEDYDTNLIGGLSATIQEFGSKGDSPYIKSISLEELKLIFTNYEQFLVVFAVDVNYPDEQFMDVVESFVQGFTNFLKEQELGLTVDGVAVSIQVMHDLISEDIHIELQMGKKVTLYAFKLKELAEKTASKFLGLKGDKSSYSYDSPDEPEEITDTESESPLATTLKQVIFRFPDIQEITLVRTTMAGEFEKYCETKLSTEISGNVHENVMGMIDLVSHLLEEPIANRTIDLDEHGSILFQKVSELSFLYIVIKDASLLDTLEPIIERVANSLVKHFPEDAEFFSE